MKSRPILFTAENAQLVHDGRKTQTRRIIKPQGAILTDALARGLGVQPPTTENTPVIPCPFGTVGDQLWCREPYYQLGHWEAVDGVLTKGGKSKWEFIPDASRIVFNTPPQYRKSIYRENPYQSLWYRRLGRFMPRKYSRTTLEITEIRAQRLLDISEEDAKSEGVRQEEGGFWNYIAGEPYQGMDATASYGTLWESINGPGSWEANPYVWAITFRKL